jgi:hypothetical protein
MPRFDPTFNLGQMALAISFVVTGAITTLGFVYGTRGDIMLMQYQIAENQKDDETRARAADVFRAEVLGELRGIKDEITKLRVEMQEKEPRKR